MVIKYDEKSNASYSLFLRWVRENARTDADAEELRRRVIAVEPRFEKYGASDGRMVEIDKSLNQSELLARVAALDKKLANALSG